MRWKTTGLVVATVLVCVAGVFFGWRSSSVVADATSRLSTSQEENIRNSLSPSARAAWDQLTDDLRVQVSKANPRLREFSIFFNLARSENYQSSAFIVPILEIVEATRSEMTLQELESEVGNDESVMGAWNLTLVVRLLHNDPPRDGNLIAKRLEQQAIRYLKFPRPYYTAFVLEYLSRFPDKYGQLSAEGRRALDIVRNQIGKDSASGVEAFLADPENF
jgi:hypothetical protein